MTAKEKAIELIDKFYSISSLDNRLYAHIFSDLEDAKQCALIAVDEILKVVSFYNDTQAEITYWEEVKQEIEKL